jgi:transcriptional regulator with GAF, ATPase, and Fis domain
MNFGRIVGKSPALVSMIARIEAVADTPASVLIIGETGTGKELVAHAIHTRSGRADGPLVKVNCASIPNELFESEFFGHVRGAYTGAHQDRIGRFQLADGGTIFLDEVGDIPLPLQGKLLRVLQEKEFERVGEDRSRKVDVRVIAATNKDLEKAVDAGEFREDLYYRLSVFPVQVPPLRKRGDDVVMLAVHFLKQVCREFGRSDLSLSQNQVEALCRYDWPGNVRT